MSPSGGPEKLRQGAYRSDRRGRDEDTVHHVALTGATGGMAGEERHRGVPGGVDDVDVLRGHDLVAGHFVGERPVLHLEDDVVAGDQLVDPPERVAVRDPVTGEHGVAELAGNGASGP